MSKSRDQLDEALDEALISYGEVSPNRGLERRILAQIAERTIHPRRTWPFAVTIGIAAITAGILIMWVTPRMAVQIQPGKSILTQNKTEPPQTKTIPARHVFLLAAKPGNHRKSMGQRNLPRFPTPSPLGSEERALLQLAKASAHDVPRELNSLGNPIMPIQVSEINIKPIN